MNDPILQRAIVRDGMAEDACIQSPSAFG